MLPGWSTSWKLLTSWWTLLSCCHIWEWGNSVGKLVDARTKSLFLQFWLFLFKNKNGALFCSSYRRWNWKNPCRKRLHKHSKCHKDCCMYICISTLILVINLFCFNNCGLFCLCYKNYNKTLDDCSLRKHLSCFPWI